MAANYTGDDKRLKYLFNHTKDYLYELDDTNIVPANLEAGQVLMYNNTYWNAAFPLEYNIYTEKAVGYWTDFSKLYQMSYEIQITNSSSVDEVIQDLSSLGFDYIGIVEATLVYGSKSRSILPNLCVNGTDLEYTGSYGTGKAYVTVRYTKSS